MTNKITVAASEVKVNDHIYNGTGSNARPTFTWETITEVRVEDGLILLVAGNVKGQHSEFWFESDELIVVMRYPVPPAFEAPPTKAHVKPPH